MLEMTDLWSDDEWHELPDDDFEAFAKLVAIARPRFQLKLRELDQSVPDDQRTALCHEYMTLLVAVAKERRVLPFSSQEMPYLRNFNDDLFQDFQSDLAMHLAKAQTRKSKRVAAGMVNLSAKDSAVLQRRVQALREKLEDAEMEPWRKKRLMAKLTEFEDALRKCRVDLAAVATLAVTLVTLPGGVYGTLQAIGVDFQKDVLAPIAEARCEAEKDEWEQKVLFPPKPNLLAAPRPIPAIRAAPAPKPKR